MNINTNSFECESNAVFGAFLMHFATATLIISQISNYIEINLKQIKGESKKCAPRIPSVIVMCIQCEHNSFLLVSECTKHARIHYVYITVGFSAVYLNSHKLHVVFFLFGFVVLFCWRISGFGECKGAAKMRFSFRNTK